jgi:hypothetical protein
MPCDAIFVTRMSGHMDMPLTTSFITLLDSWLARRSHDLSAFHDWAQMNNYDLSARVALTRWTLTHRPAFREAHLLVRSKIVELGVEAANLTLGRFMTTHRDLPTFERALQSALTRHHVELVI